MTAARIGTTGENGTLNGRLRSGRLRRRTGTAIETRVKAASVPMFTISSSLPIGVSDAVSATSDPMIKVSLIGVPVRGLIRARLLGSSQSRHIAKRTRVAPIISVMTTVVSPATAPPAMSVAYPPLPTDSKALARAAEGSIWS